MFHTTVALVHQAKQRLGIDYDPLVHGRRARAAARHFHGRVIDVTVNLVDQFMSFYRRQLIYTRMYVQLSKLVDRDSNYDDPWVDALFSGEDSDRPKRVALVLMSMADDADPMAVAKYLDRFLRWFFVRAIQFEE